MNVGKRLPITHVQKRPFHIELAFVNADTNKNRGLAAVRDQTAEFHSRL
ncbi:hypothetical protein D039_0837A, partial [Vibrio parahaemolyticus EKP-028]